MNPAGAAEVKEAITKEAARLVLHLVRDDPPWFPVTGGDPFRRLDLERANRQMARGLEPLAAAMVVAVLHMIREQGRSVSLDAAMRLRLERRRGDLSRAQAVR